jgi:hypothetical protein
MKFRRIIRIVLIATLAWLFLTTAFGCAPDQVLLSSQNDGS